MTRTPSPADVRCDLNPDAVDALALELHRLHCIPLASYRDPNPPNLHHANMHRSVARFLLMRVRDHGYTLTPTTNPTH